MTSVVLQKVLKQLLINLLIITIRGDNYDWSGGYDMRESGLVGVGVAEDCWLGDRLAFGLLLAVLADFLDPPFHLCLVLCCLFRGFACLASEAVFLH